MKLIEKLSKIQQELNVPKTEFNKFGGFAYRSIEQIIEKVKPLLKKYNVSLLLDDDIVIKGDRYYVKSIASLVDVDNGEKIEAVAYAREAENKKGMDEAQITGACSSYARKYALSGLFLLDNGDDPDRQDNTEKDKNYKIKQNKKADKEWDF